MRVKQQGFTLVELLVAMGVLAVIAAIAIPAYNGYIAESRKTEGWNNLAAIKLAQEEYFLENNRYFPDTNGTTVSTTAGTLSTYWDPSEGNDRNFNYSVFTSSGNDYTATAIGRGSGYTVPATTSFSISK